MGRPNRRRDPIGSRASRVEKHRRSKKTRHDLPAWFCRVASIEYTKNRGIRPTDYDQDLSELEEADEPTQPSSEQDSAVGCECDSDDSECECHLEADEDGMDTESERSCEGSVAEYYYFLKDNREERKRELLKERRRNEEKKEEQMKFEKAKEEEVNAAYKSFKKARRRARKEGRTIPIDSIAEQGFKLFSSDHVDRFFEPYATKLVNFYYVDVDEYNDDDEAEDEDSSQYDREQVSGMYGYLYFGSKVSCSFGPFRLPTRARRKDVKVKSRDGKYDLWFKFFGNGYLKLSVSRDLVFKNGLGSSSTTPEIFDFVGIVRNFEKEKQERAEEREKERGRKAKQRSPSPRESWFEMNHPMGSWNQMGW
jgi:hypothetical protein